MSRYIDLDTLGFHMSRFGFESPEVTITEFIEDILPRVDVVPKEKYKGLLQNAIILADALIRYEREAETRYENDGREGNWNEFGGEE